MERRCIVKSRKFDIIYADPPWRYTFSKSKNRGIENQYPTMSLEEIKSLKIPAADNSILYLWATAPKLIEALEVMEAWGFKYKTHAIWNKGIMGMGYWWRGQHELLLVGTHGKVSPPPPNLRESSIYFEKRTKHSKKPSHFREFIDKCFPEATKLELFARESSEGWDTWGNEVENTVFLP